MNNRDRANAFGPLNFMPIASVISSVYYAIRLLRHREQFDVHHGMSLIAEGVPSEPTGDDRRTALLIVRRIEELEDVPFHRLSKDAADDYIALLSDIVLNRVQEDFGVDPVRGEELLHELRAQATPHPPLVSENNAN